jgi:hypothetical protein
MQTIRHERPVPLDRYREVTHLFPVFLGLRLLPVGLWFLIAALPGVGGFGSSLHKLLLVVAIAAVWWTHRWYRERYGVVEPRKLSLGRSWVLLFGWLAAVVAMSFGGALLGLRPLVLLVVLILLATAALWSLPRLFGPGAPLLTAFIALAAVAGVLMLGATRDPADLGAGGGLFKISVGVLLCLAGVLEHRSLVDAFEGAGELADD